MSRFSQLLAPDRGEQAVIVRLVAETDFDAFRAAQQPLARAAIDVAGFKGAADTHVIVPAGDGSWGLAVGIGKATAPQRFTLASAAAALPEGRYRLEGDVPAVALHGWLMAQHRFDRYKKAAERGPRQLLVQNVAAIERALAEADAAAELRDLVDTPAEDLGPDELEEAIRSVAASHGATVQSVVGDALLEQNFPAIHAVGRASPRRPRIVTLDWGEDGQPLVALVGKGVCFDTGGLNLKPGGSMGLMKKDMGGAAHALALARMIMAARLPVRLKLVVATVDNAVSGNALRPGDVISTRHGLSVEIGNTDAEGRLILADALALAVETEPTLILDFATLTGAARVALGPDLPALFANDDDLATGLLAGGTKVCDPLWRLPLWQDYNAMFRSTIADINNNAEGGMAGAITAALFLQRFVPDTTAWAHLDVYAWNANARPGRPKGGAAMGVFAAFHYLQSRFG